jgi:Rieske Fe-S protein
MSPLDRRSFLLRGGCALAALATGCASLVAVRVVSEDGVVRLSLPDHPSLAGAGGWLKVQPDTWDAPLYVLALEDGDYAAVSPVCTHQGCTVDIAGPRLVCPCHGSTYDREGRVLRGPAENALRRFPVRGTQAGEILIDIRGAA